MNETRDEIANYPNYVTVIKKNNMYALILQILRKKKTLTQYKSQSLSIPEIADLFKNEITN